MLITVLILGYNRLHVSRAHATQCNFRICSWNIFSIFPSNQFETQVFANFWAGHVFYQVCLGSGPRGTLIPKKMMGVVSSFLSLFENHPSCVCLVDCPDRLTTCFKTFLPGSLRPTSVNGFGTNELERCLSLPTSRILERHDYRTILDFLLMKLRTALERLASKFTDTS